MYEARLKSYYSAVVVPALQKEFNYGNVMQIPAVKKIVVNMGVKEGVTDAKVVDQACADLMLITGQKPVITKAYKSIAAFKLRKGMPIGCKVTLRGKVMYEFLDRLINIALPRGRDFRGLSPRQFDGQGNYSLGLKEHIIFPEIDYDKTVTVRGMGIVIVTDAPTNEEALALLKAFNMPFAA